MKKFNSKDYNSIEEVQDSLPYNSSSSSFSSFSVIFIFISGIFLGYFFHFLLTSFSSSSSSSFFPFSSSFSSFSSNFNNKQSFNCNYNNQNKNNYYSPLPSHFSFQNNNNKDKDKDYNNKEDIVMFMHISDTHIDLFFNPNQSISKGVCHSCNLYNTCPNMPNNTTIYDLNLKKQGYAFGRYGCNPPYLLFTSLLQKMIQIDPNPPVIVFTGDISPHAYPDDNHELLQTTNINDLCELKFLVTEKMIKELVTTFPNTKWAYTLGNNDHFPKDIYWQPYIDRYGKMLLDTGFFTYSQYESFISHGCSFIDVDNIRYLSIDMMVFAPYGIAFSNYSEITLENRGNRLRGVEQINLLRRLLSWLESSLHEASQLNLSVYLIGHQPLTTKEGRNEMDVECIYYSRFKTLLSAYSSIIKVGLFGHHNYAFVEEILSTSYIPLIPSIIAPGVSPRGKNNPAFNLVYRSKSTGVILDFKQIKFNLLEENNIAKLNHLHNPSYLGKWTFHDDVLHSWQTLSNQKEFTTETLYQFLSHVPKSQELYLAMQVWRTTGYIGEDTPEGYKCRAKYDQEEPLMKCLFPEQNITCWNPREWLQLV